MILLLASLAFAGDSKNLYTGAGSPFPIGKNRVAFGLFRPVSIGLSDKTELSTTGLESLVAPQMDVKHQVWAGDNSGVAIVGGLGVPTLGLKMIQGTVLSSDPNQTVTFASVFKAGAIAGVRQGSFRLSAGIEARAAAKAGQWGLEPPGWFWLDPMLAPLTEGPVLKTRVVIDCYPDNAPVGLTLDTWVQMGGIGPDLESRLFGEWALGQHVALGAGLAAGSERFERGRDSQVWTGLFDLRFRW